MELCGSTGSERRLPPRRRRNQGSIRSTCRPRRRPSRSVRAPPGSRRGAADARPTGRPRPSGSAGGQARSASRPCDSRAAATLIAPRLSLRPKTLPRAEAPKARRPDRTGGLPMACGRWRLALALRERAGRRPAPARTVRRPDDGAGGDGRAGGHGAAGRLLSSACRRDANALTGAPTPIKPWTGCNAPPRQPMMVGPTRRGRATTRPWPLARCWPVAKAAARPNPAAAEARLRQAAAGSRADAVLALGQFLESQAGEDADRLAEARGLYARVAQLGDASALQREGQRGLQRIDALAKPEPPCRDGSFRSKTGPKRRSRQSRPKRRRPRKRPPRPRPSRNRPSLVSRRRETTRRQGRAT
jgi:hypothetical protein